MKARLAAALIAWAAIAAAPPPPGSAPAGVEILEDGSIVARPSGIRLPRTIRGPKYTHNAKVALVSADRSETTYGPISIIISAPSAEADPIMQPGEPDDDPPSLPSLLFWGEAAEPVTYSMLRAVGGKNWLAFVMVTQGWQIEISSLHAPEDRDVVIRTAEAVWATLAAANTNLPR